MRGDANAIGRARRLFEAQSREAYQRNGRCECEHRQTVEVLGKEGVKQINLGAGAAKHFSACRHSELERTTRPDVPKKPRRRNRAA